MAENRMIRVGITQGDVNGIGPEVIIKTLADPRMSELFVPVVYGSSKVFSYYRKGLPEGETFSFQITGSAREARPKRVNLVETGTGEVRIEPGTATREGGAEAVNALRRAQTSARYSGRLAEVSDIWVSGGAVRISLTTDNRSFVSRLDIPIVKSGTESSTFPIGTGPYAYSGEGGAHLAKNASWWQGKPLPLDRIELTACKDTDSVSYAFYAREIQLLFCDLTGADTSNVYGSGDYTDAATSIMQYLCLNTRRAPFDNPAVRRAVTLGVDRAGCVSAFLLGHGMAAHFPLSPASDLYPKELETAYSPDGYASALEAAGLHTGKTRSLTLLVNQENSFKVSTAQKIAAGLSQYDLQVTVQALPNEEYLQALQNGDFDLCFCEVKLTADWDLRPLLQSYASLNFGGYADPETDQLLAGLCAAEPAGRAAAMTALCKKLEDQAPIVPVCFKSYSVLLPAGAALQPITPTAANPFCGISDWKLNMK